MKDSLVIVAAFYAFVAALPAPGYRNDASMWSLNEDGRYMDLYDYDTPEELHMMEQTVGHLLPNDRDRYYDDDSRFDFSVRPGPIYQPPSVQTIPIGPPTLRTAPSVVELVRNPVPEIRAVVDGAANQNDLGQPEQSQTIPAAVPSLGMSGVSPFQTSEITDDGVESDDENELREVVIDRSPDHDPARTTADVVASPEEWTVAEPQVESRELAYQDWGQQSPSALASPWHPQEEEEAEGDTPNLEVADPELDVDIDAAVAHQNGRQLPQEEEEAEGDTPNLEVADPELEVDIDAAVAHQNREQQYPDNVPVSQVITHQTASEIESALDEDDALTYDEDEEDIATDVTFADSTLVGGYFAKYFSLHLAITPSEREFWKDLYRRVQIDQSRSVRNLGRLDKVVRGKVGGKKERKVEFGKTIESFKGFIMELNHQIQQRRELASMQLAYVMLKIDEKPLFGPQVFRLISKTIRQELNVYASSQQSFMNRWMAKLYARVWKPTKHYFDKKLVGYPRMHFKSLWNNWFSFEKDKSSSFLKAWVPFLWYYVRDNLQFTISNAVRELLADPSVNKDQLIDTLTEFANFAASAGRRRPASPYDAPEDNYMPIVGRAKSLWEKRD